MLRSRCAAYLLAAAALLLPAFGAAAASAEEPSAQRYVAGQIWLRDLRPRFITIPEELLTPNEPWQHFVVGNFHDTPTDDLLLLTEGAAGATIVLFDNNGLVSLHWPLEIEWEPGADRAADPVRQIIPGRFSTYPEGVLALTKRGRLLHLRLATAQSPALILGGKAEFGFSNRGPLRAAVWGEVPAGSRLLAVGRLNADDHDDLLLHHPSEPKVILAISDAANRFELTEHGHACNELTPETTILAGLDAQGEAQVYCTDAGTLKRVFGAGKAGAADPAVATIAGGDRPLLAADLSGDRSAELVAGTRQGALAVYVANERIALPQVPPLDPQSVMIVRFRPEVPPELVAHESGANVWHRFRLEGAEIAQLEPLAAPDLGGETIALRGRFRLPDRESIILLSRATRRWALSNVENLLEATEVRVFSDQGVSGFSDREGWLFLSGLGPGSHTFSASLLGLTFYPRRAHVVVPEVGGKRLEFVADVNGGPAPTGPAVCNGIDPDRLDWGFNMQRTRRYVRCAEGQAAYGMDDADTPFGVSCCPLPADDVLTGVSAVVDAECPEGMVIASATRTSTSVVNLTYNFRCRAINTERYQLGPPLPGVEWSDGTARRRTAKLISRLDIPPAIRYGIGRSSLFEFGDDGCIGDPPGSLLVAKHSKYCKDMRFRQLQYRGRPGDPPAGTPVEMFPDCIDISSPFDPVPACALRAQSVGKARRRSRQEP